MSFGFGVGDFIAISQLTFKLYHQCYLVARGAPQEFQLLVGELNNFQSSLKILEVEVNDPNSILVRSGEDRVRMMQEMIKRVEATLLQLQEFAKKYSKLMDDSRSKPKKMWDKFKWSFDMSEIEALRNKLVYHNGVIHLLLTSAGNSSLQRLESSTQNIERRLSNINVLIAKSQQNSINATGQQKNGTEFPVLSSPALNGESNLWKYKFTHTLMKNAEAGGRWNSIGIHSWIKAGRWWLLRYRYQLQTEPGDGKSLHRETYVALIKATWIMSDVIHKHPQLNFLDSVIQSEVQILVEVCFFPY
ncbi:hypothetical protein DFH27DRAFT_327215 [Peziza echinospora]|nr:hypothetical protein DFH27DRAFT_327215 [Peziza echinospora]